MLNLTLLTFKLYLPSPSDEDVDELWIESHVDPRVQAAVQCLQPEQPGQ